LLRLALVPSPIAGAEGNVEFLMLLSRVPETGNRLTMPPVRVSLIARTVPEALKALEAAAVWLDAHGAAPSIEQDSAAAAGLEAAGQRCRARRSRATPTR
jgi:hypothetical protein